MPMLLGLGRRSLEAVTITMVLSALGAGCDDPVSVIDGDDAGGRRDGQVASADAAAGGDAARTDGSTAIDDGSTAIDDGSTALDDGGASGDDGGPTPRDAGPPGDAGPRPRAVAVAAGGMHTCALLDDDRVFCWGDGIHGPTEVPGVRASAIAAGGAFTCAIVTTPSGSTGVSCWGRVNDTLSYTGATDVGIAAVEISAGESHACARPAGGGVVQCWGSNDHGPVGDGSTTDRAAPVATPVVGARAIGLGQQHSCAALASSAQCWGWSHAGQSGVTSETNPTPQTVSFFVVESIADEIDGGDDFTCVRISGNVGCWGSNARGQLGDPSISGMRLDADTRISELISSRSLTAGGSTACVLEGEGSLVTCWGENARGQAGGAGDTVPRPRAIEIAGGLLRGNDVSVGPDHGCAVTGSGEVSCWGDNVDGALGDPALPTGATGGTVTRVPVAVVGLP
jgi:alpha-tubulin suppressor-like RCC1 family protein